MDRLIHSFIVAKTKRKNRESSGASTSSTISSVELEQVIEQLKADRHHDSTKKNYYAIWKLFNKFFVRLDKKPETWGERLTLFVGYLVQNKKCSVTVKSYISAIRAVLNNASIKVKTDECLLLSLTQACKLRNDIVHTRLPIMKQLLGVIIEKTRTKFESAGQPYLSLLYQTIFATAYYGLFRVGELTMSPHVIKAKDVHMGRNKRKFLFVLHSSKTHNKGDPPQMVKIAADPLEKKTRKASDGIKPPCPFVLLAHYKKARGPRLSDDEPFFVHIDHSSVTPWQMRNCLKIILKEANYNEDLYGTHSLRIGRATSLLQLGLSVETIKKLRR